MLLVICSKSTWSPTIRREHAVAESAAADGHQVVFIERALDVRALRSSRSRRSWLRQLRSCSSEIEPSIRVMPQSTLVPGHRSSAAQWLDAKRLKATLRRIPSIDTAVVIATQPWQWPAVAGAPAARRVFDCADDWRSLVPHRFDELDAMCRRIATEADAVILASSDLLPAFPGREVTVVANGTSTALADAPVRPLPEALVMVYAGTLSERFDAQFLLDALDHLPGWSVELYGQCQYAGCGTAPGPELQRVLDAGGERIRWYGPVRRENLAAVLDHGRVLIASHRSSLTRGQDSMKLYDYATRDRPIVCTPGALGSPDHIAGAQVREAATPADFARAVAEAGQEGAHVKAARRAWAAAQTWDSRWPRWARAALGDNDSTGESR
jgi:glycosyltransferase involved in cell wall biosynthesis